MSGQETYPERELFTLEATAAKKLQVMWIQLEVDPRYWEDSEVNGVSDEKGTLIPCRYGDLWCPSISIADGWIQGWPHGTTASIHYKVCDQGEYYLLNEFGERVAKWRGYYVPDEILCPDAGAFGDYIIFNVAEDGKVVGWKTPNPDCLSAKLWDEVTDSD